MFNLSEVIDGKLIEYLRVESVIFYVFKHKTWKNFYFWNDFKQMDRVFWSQLIYL